MKFSYVFRGNLRYKTRGGEVSGLMKNVKDRNFVYVHDIQQHSLVKRNLPCTELNTKSLRSGINYFSPFTSSRDVFKNFSSLRGGLIGLRTSYQVEDLVC